jgi:predicted peptidase
MFLAAAAFIARTVTVEGKPHKYQVWVPATYDASRKWPAILFLHGVGERGHDGKKQTTVGLGPALRDGTVKAEAIVIFPQCPEEQRWVNAAPIAIAALDDAERQFSIDEDRVALTGMSMGGAGVWALAAAYPTRWSALAPICGYVHRPANVPELGNVTKESYADFASRLPLVPIWIFHGSDDDTVPVTESRAMADVLGENAAYTEFPCVGHYAWDPAYTGTHLVQWLTEQRRQ